MSPHKEKLALFIDGANLYPTAKSLGFDIDCKRLLREFQSRGDLLRAFYYTAVIEDQEFSSIRPLIDWLDCEMLRSFEQQSLRASRQLSISFAARRAAFLFLPRCCLTYHGI